MPASTPNRGVPYPVATDPINAYPTVAAAAAGVLDRDLVDRVAAVGPMPSQFRTVSQVPTVTPDANGRFNVGFGHTFGSVLVVVATVETTGTAGVAPCTVLTIEARRRDGFSGHAYQTWDGGRTWEPVRAAMAVNYIAYGID